MIIIHLLKALWMWHGCIILAKERTPPVDMTNFGTVGMEPLYFGWQKIPNY